MSPRERFLVTVEVDVAGTEGGWNSTPILDAAKAALNGERPESFLSLTIERKSEREVSR